MTLHSKFALPAFSILALVCGAAPAVHADRNTTPGSGASTVGSADGLAAGGDASLASPKYGAWGFDLSGMDRSVDPGDDFFRFANGKWLERTEIPADRTRFGNFDVLSVLSENRVHAILEEAAGGWLADPDAGKIGAAYASFMNETLAGKLDAQPIAGELAEIRAVRTKAAFTALMGKSTATGFASILPVYINIDAKSPTRYAVYATTAGLGLPDRDYYLLPAFAEKKARSTPRRSTVSGHAFHRGHAQWSRITRWKRIVVIAMSPVTAMP